MFVWEKYDLADAEAAYARSGWRRQRAPAKMPAGFRHVIRGRVQHVGNVKGWGSAVYTKLATRLEIVDPTFRRTLSPGLGRATVRVVGEGETDAIHLRAAWNHFYREGEFASFQLHFEDLPESAGGPALLAFAKALAFSKQTVGCVCVFDSDDLKTLKAAGLDKADLVPFGRGIAGVRLVPPAFERDPRLCVEMLHADETLQRQDEAGRRVFLAEEFDDQSGHHKSGDFTIPNPSSTQQVPPKVFKVGSPSTQTFALSKRVFAESIEKGAAPYDTVAFDGFRPTLELIERAARLVVDQVADDRAEVVD